MGLIYVIVLLGANLVLLLIALPKNTQQKAPPKMVVLYVRYVSLERLVTTQALLQWEVLGMRKRSPR